MFRSILSSFLLFVIVDIYVTGCLITNCPPGGKRSGKFRMIEGNFKPCASCGPGHTGQCFGQTICCGPFGCLMNTSDTMVCQREWLLNGRELCLAGGAPCMRNTGRCATENICCNQDSCHVDKQCSSDEKLRPFADNALGQDLYNLVNNYPPETAMEK